jgi:hypothetical protein
MSCPGDARYALFCKDQLPSGGDAKPVLLEAVLNDDLARTTHQPVGGDALRAQTRHIGTGNETISLDDGFGLVGDATGHAA